MRDKFGRKRDDIELEVSPPASRIRLFNTLGTFHKEILHFYVKNRGMMEEMGDRSLGEGTAVLSLGI